MELYVILYICNIARSRRIIFSLYCIISLRLDSMQLC